MNTPPTFEETMEFNKILWPRFREDFAKGNFTQEQALKFLEEHSPIAKPKKIIFEDKYVIFIKVPEHLKNIITPEHAYYRHEEKNGEYYVTLDNDYAHWVNKEYFRPCPLDEVQVRSSYTQNHFEKK